MILTWNGTGTYLGPPQAAWTWSDGTGSGSLVITLTPSGLRFGVATLIPAGFGAATLED